MIPKIIHYCWFGNKPLPELARKCISSWEKYCSDYQIKEWNESNFDLDACAYIREAYEKKKWAFVSDYARFWILYREGGVYFDTDVEVLKPIDLILEKGAFFGLERREDDSINKLLIATGLGMGAESNNIIYKEILNLYETLHFVNSDGTINKKTVVAYVTQIMNNHGLTKECENINQIFEIENMTIYPWEYFCPMSYKSGILNITENTYTIHHYTASWKSDEEILMKKISNSLENKFGKSFGGKVAKLCIIPIRLKAKVKEIGVKNTFKILLKLK